MRFLPLSRGVAWGPGSASGTSWDTGPTRTCASNGSGRFRTSWPWRAITTGRSSAGSSCSSSTRRPTRRPWTRERLPAEDREFLARLPLVVETDRLTVVHGSLDEPALFEYIQTPAQALRTMRRLHTPVGFLGHSHVSGFFRFDGRRIDILSGDAERVDPAARLLVNIGSVGQPRDDDARASFGVYDDASGLVELFREPYDIAMAARKIQEAGLPPLLAERLGFGR